MVQVEIPSFQDWRQSPEGPLHIIFIVHLVLSAWSMLGYWSANKLLMQNTFFLLCLLWSLHDKSNNGSPVVLSLIIDVVSIVLDIIVLAVFYPHDAKSSEQFSAVMAIFNLIFRIASIYVIWKYWKHRSDSLDGGGPRVGSVIGGSVISGSVLGGTRPSRADAEKGPNNNSAAPAYGFQPYQGSPRQELPAIPPSYSQHA